MSIIKYVERLRRINSLIARKSTGTPDEFAEKLGIKRSTLFQYLQEIKEMGVDIRYSTIMRSYYYPEENGITIRFECRRPLNTTVFERRQDSKLKQG